MDNNQNNQQDEYTNFNNYQQPSQPQNDPTPNNGTVPTYTVPPQQGTTPPQQQYIYQGMPVEQQPKHKGTSMALGIISIVLCVLGICCGCATIFGIAMIVVGLILGIVGVVLNKKSAVSWVGLVMSAIFLILGALIYAVIMSNPEAVREILEESGIYSDQMIEEYMDALYGFIVSKL